MTTYHDLFELALRLMDEFFTIQPLHHHDPNCDEQVIIAVNEMLAVQLESVEDAEPDRIAAVTEEAMAAYRAMFIPPREHVGSPILEFPCRDAVASQLNTLHAVPQPEQRTPEWYAFRGRYLTASSAWKAFSTESALNQLIYDKCRAATAEPESRAGRGVNVDSPLHWGQKYEPVSVMWYERHYGTKVGEFGCIPHPTIPCLAASPDGINIDPKNARYGRMLEIKNVVSREITGIPKKDYWIQMQLQMAVCGLHECDFLETKFSEYDNEEDWEADGTPSLSSDGKMKGRIIQFMDLNGPSYEYQPLGLVPADVIAWEKSVHEAHAGDTWIRDIFWKLEVVSCVLVEFNACWMSAAEVRLRATWDVIQLEKQTGFEHRAPQKRKRVEPLTNEGEPQQATSCLLVADGKGGFKPLPGGGCAVDTVQHREPPAADIRVVTSPLARTSTRHRS